MEIMMEYLAKGFVTMLSVSIPCVLVAASIGLVVGILQAVTQVQEQTIAAAPKIILVFLTLVILGSLFVKNLTEYLLEGANIAFNILPKNENYVLPANYYRYTKPFASEMKDAIIQPGGQTEELMKNPGKLPWTNIQDKSKFTPAQRGANPSPNFIERNKIMGR